jgi:hypothetical protein
MKRTLLLGTAWTASAAAAVGLGFLAVSFVDASASPGTVPLAATSSPTASTEPTVGPSALQPTGQEATEAGMVYASCDRGAPEVAGAPAGGWWVDNSDKPGEVEFEDGTRKLEVHVTCVDGSPIFSVEGPRAEDSDDRDDRDDDGSASSAPAPTDAPDDSDGRPGGGHGSDDPPGDDNGGDSAVGDSDDSDDSDDDSGKGRGRGSDD